jgi:hypothetical protein
VGSSKTVRMSSRFFRLSMVISGPGARLCLD